MLIRLLDVTKRELLRDLQRATEPYQSRVFKAVYEKPYGTFGAVPFGLLVGNFDFGPSAEDVELLEGLSIIASVCHAPFIAAAAPEMFGIESFQDLLNPRDLFGAFDSAMYGHWKRFRHSEDA